MPRVTLAHWHAGRPPGTELDVTDEEFRQLVRDGRVAAVTEPVPDVAPQEPADETEPEPEAVAESEPEPEAVAESEPQAGRAGRRRR